MLTRENPLFTPTEAAVLTRLSVKAINNAIDRRTVPAISGSRAGYATRLLDLRALVSLTLERRLADRFAPEFRREVFEAVAKASGNTVLLDGGFLKIDLREPRRELAALLRTLRQARRLVSIDPEVLGGEPAFGGTRIPVHLIAALLRQGSTEAELLEGYPRLTPAMISIAPVYANAYPPRGRPRAEPWRDQPPVRRSRRKLASIATA